MLLSDTTQLKSVAGIGKQLALTFKLSLKMGKSYKFCYFSGWDAYHATAAPQVRFLQETSVACCALSASHVSSQACLKLLPNEPKYVGESLFGSSNIMTQIVRHIAYNYSHFSPNQNKQKWKTADSFHSGKVSHEWFSAWYFNEHDRYISRVILANNRSESEHMLSVSAEVKTSCF